MKNGRFSDAQIMAVLKQAAGGVLVSELCREHGMSSASFYKWRAKFGGMHCTAGYRAAMSREWTHL
jgi:putative transposase